MTDKLVKGTGRDAKPIPVAEGNQSAAELDKRATSVQAAYNAALVEGTEATFSGTDKIRYTSSGTSANS